MIIDLHQDLILSYEHDINQFITFDPTVYIDHHDTNAWSLKDYQSQWISMIRWVSRPYILQGDLRDKANRTITYTPEKLTQYLDQYKQLAQYPWINLVYKYDDIKSDQLNILLHIEWFDNVQSLDDIKNVYDQWVRSIGFVRNFDNSLCTCNLNTSWQWLTALWRQVVEYMDRLWMIIDTAHMSHPSIMDVVSISKKPIINSHSNIQALYNHPRNVQDEFLVALEKNGGVLWLSFCKSFMTKTSSLDLEQYFQQIDYVRNMIGDEHIALGTDYHWLTHEDIIDGYDKISSLNTFHQLMIERYGEPFSNKFLYTNAQRILSTHLS